MLSSFEKPVVPKLVAYSLSLLISLAICAPGTARAQYTPLSVGAGSLTDVYYAVGMAMCRLVNKDRAENKLRCMVESTGGSVFNVIGLKHQEIDLGMAQSNVAYNAYMGQGQFQAIGKIARLRSVFSLHAEPLTVVVSKEAQISSIDQLQGKRVNIGSPGSGTRVVLEQFLQEKGWDESVFSKVFAYRPEELGAALCGGRIDGFFYSVGHPSVIIQDPLSTCGAQLLPLEGPAVQALVQRYPYYSLTHISASAYPSNAHDVPSFGALATVLSTDQVPEETVYSVVKAVFENFDDFKRLHPALSGLRKQDMIKNGLTAPLHAGAIRYYKEAGLL